MLLHLERRPLHGWVVLARWTQPAVRVRPPRLAACACCVRPLGAGAVMVGPYLCHPACLRAEWPAWLRAFVRGAPQSAPH